MNEGDHGPGVRRPRGDEAGGRAGAVARPWPGHDPRPGRGREPRGRLHPLRHLRAQAESALHAGHRRGGHDRSRRARRDGVKQGDRVYAHAAVGGYAEVALCEDWQAHPLPARVSFAQGAAMGVPYATAWRALFIRARARAGEVVLVHGGSGGVGTAAVQIARAHGMQVIATAGTAEGARARARAGRAPRAQSPRGRLPAADPGAHRRPRRGRGAGDAGQREPGSRPRRAGAGRARRRHRQPRPRGDRPAQGDGQGRAPSSA